MLEEKEGLKESALERNSGEEVLLFRRRLQGTPERFTESHALIS
jgi:hypothetical protein